MEKRYTDLQYLFKNLLSSKVSFKANYLDLPSNNCFYLCITECIKSLALNMDKANSDYANQLIKNFYNFLINDSILETNYPAVYGTLLSKLKDFIETSKLSKKELYGFLLDTKKRNSLNYYKALYSEVIKIIDENTLDNLDYKINIFNVYLNEIVARGTDIRFLNYSIRELDCNPVFENFNDYIKYIGSFQPFNQDALDILLPVKLDNAKDNFIEICHKRKQQYVESSGGTYSTISGSGYGNNMGGSNNNGSTSTTGSNGKRIVKVWHDCPACNGKGRVPHESNAGQFGLSNDYKVYCSECGREFWKSTGHTHVTCRQCNGKRGYYTEKYE